MDDAKPNILGRTPPAPTLPKIRELSDGTEKKKKRKKPERHQSKNDHSFCCKKSYEEMGKAYADSKPKGPPQVIMNVKIASSRMPMVLGGARTSMSSSTPSRIVSGSSETLLNRGDVSSNGAHSDDTSWSEEALFPSMHQRKAGSPTKPL